MAKKEKSQKKQRYIITKTKADGTSDVIITKSPSKTTFGRIILAILAISMVVGTVAGLIIVFINYING